MNAIGLDGPCGEHGGGIKLSSEHSQQQSIEYFRNNLRGRIQGKNNDLRCEKNSTMPWG